MGNPGWFSRVVLHALHLTGNGRGLGVQRSCREINRAGGVV